MGGTARIWGAEAGRSEGWGCHSARCPPPAAPAGARSGMGPARYPRPDGPGPVGTGPTKRGRIATWRLGKIAHGSVWCGSDAVPVPYNAKSQVGLCREPSSRPEEPLSLHPPALTPLTPHPAAHYPTPDRRLWLSSHCSIPTRRAVPTRASHPTSEGCWCPHAHPTPSSRLCGHAPATQAGLGEGGCLDPIARPRPPLRPPSFEILGCGGGGG